MNPTETPPEAPLQLPQPLPGDAPHTAPPVADSALPGWILRAPGWARPYMELARLDRPIGIWLLLWPCWWSIALAAGPPGGGAGGLVDHLPDLLLLVLFGIGAVAMRGAGCTVNDLVDRKLDARVARTANRPLASGRVSVFGALVFLFLLCAIGLGVLLLLNPFTIWLGFAVVVPVVIYPFLKRYTDWPQIGLGLVFNWGALMGWSAVTGGLGFVPVYLYAAGIAWTIGYDTIYAHMDKADDVKVGVRSSALALGPATRPVLVLLYLGVLGLLALCGFLVGLSDWFYWMLIPVGLHFGWQVVTVRLDDPVSCLTRFRSNAWAGLLIFLAILAGQFGLALQSA